MQVIHKSYLTKITKVRKMGLYNYEGKNTKVKNMINMARNRNMEEISKGMVEVTSRYLNRFKDVMESKMINLKTPKIKEESIHQVYPIEKVWSIITTSQKYPTTPGMSLILNLIE